MISTVPASPARRGPASNSAGDGQELDRRGQDRRRAGSYSTPMSDDPQIRPCPIPGVDDEQATGHGRSRADRALCARGRYSVDERSQALRLLLEAQRNQARVQAPELLAEVDPDRVLLLWFTIGAIEMVSRAGKRPGDPVGDTLFREAVQLIFDDEDRAARSAASRPARPERTTVERFEQAGRDSVQDCLTGPADLTHYLNALRADSRSRRRIDA